MYIIVHKTNNCDVTMHKVKKVQNTSVFEFRTFSHTEVTYFEYDPKLILACWKTIGLQRRQNQYLVKFFPNEQWLLLTIFFVKSCPKRSRNKKREIYVPLNLARTR